MALQPCKGKDTILLVLDTFSKQVRFIPCLGLPLAKQLACVFMQHAVKLHYFPDKIISDWEGQFIVKFWWEFLILAGVEQGLRLGYHPKTDDQSERVN